MGGKSKKLDYIPHTDSNYFGLTSDWHIGNKHTNEDYILDYLDLLKERGVKDVFHGGDLFEGIRIYRSQIDNLHKDSLDMNGQIDRLNKLIPEQKDLNFYLISGNHLVKHRNRRDPVKTISKSRKDFTHLGVYQGKVKLEDNVELELIHPSRNSKYPDLSYMSNYPEYMDLPDILGIGHLHKSGYEIYKGIPVFYLGTFLEETQSRKNKFKPDIGAWIVELEIDGGKIEGGNLEWIEYPLQ